jgi:hypothetical protein
VPANTAERARDLERLYCDLFDAQSRGLHSAVSLFGVMAFGAASLIPSGLLVAGLVAVGGGSVHLVRTLRRAFDARRFCREARLVDAHPVAPGEPLDRRGGWYQLLEISDDDRHVVARVKRRWPRSSFAVDPRCVKTWYAPGSSIVISFDAYGEPILGSIVTAPLPRAQLAQR